MNLTTPTVTFGQLSIGDRFHRDSETPVYTKISQTQARLHSQEETSKRTKGYGFEPKLVIIDDSERIWFNPVVTISRTERI